MSAAYNGLVKRLRLHCYSVENILLSNDSLNEFGFNEEDFINEIKSWIESKSNHTSSNELKTLAANFNNRRTANIKNIRNIIVALLDSKKPWEVMVGQVIANILLSSNNDDNSIKSYLGSKVISEQQHSIIKLL